jgi:hypothetical protein
MYYDASDQALFVCSEGVWGSLEPLTWFDNVGIGLRNGARAEVACDYLFYVHRRKHEGVTCKYRAEGYTKKENGKLYTKARIVPISTRHYGECSDALYDSGWIEGIEASVNTPGTCYHAKAKAVVTGITIDHPAAVEGGGRYQALACFARASWGEVLGPVPAQTPTGGLISEMLR